MRDDLGIGYSLAPDGSPRQTFGEPCKVNFADPRPDTRTTAERMGDVLLESHREDTSAEFRLGLLQGALAIALPELIEATVRVNQVVRIDLKRDELLRCADEVAASMKNTRGVAGAPSKAGPRAKGKARSPRHRATRRSPGHA